MENNMDGRSASLCQPERTQQTTMEASAKRHPKQPFAWVALVMGLDLSYVGAALVLASSLKRRSKRADLVVMVTPDVPEPARSAMAEIFDVVVEVPYLETLALQKYSERFDRMYNYWLDKCFTKFALFGLTEYRKVIFLDSDMLAVEDPDSLFDCPAPAGICSAVRENRDNERMHGQKLPRTIVEESLKNGQGRYGVRGCLLVMEPCEATLSRIRSKVESREHYGSVESMVGPDELLITRHFINEWSHIHAKYGWVSWADREELGVDPVFLHYVSQKPWDEGESWEDFKYWKEEAREVVKEVPSGLGFFGRLMDEIGTQAGVEVTPEMRAQARELEEGAKVLKMKAKADRETRAARLGIDLAANFTPRVTPRGGRLNALRQAPILGINTSGPNSMLRTGHTSSLSSGQKPGPGPNSGRWRSQLPADGHASGEAPKKGSTPELQSNPPPPLESKSGKVTKASPNILVVDGFKRPYPSKPRPEKTAGGGNATNSASTNTAARPNAVPKLNLAVVKTDGKSSQQVKSPEDSERAGDPGTWPGSHWHSKKRGTEPPSSVRSVADEKDSWRRNTGSSVQSTGPQSARPWVTGQDSRLTVTPPATARPYIGVQDTTAVSPPGSARPWVAGQDSRGVGNLPGSARRRQYPRWDAPKSSRADMASSWRSTPRAGNAERPDGQRLSPTQGWGGGSLGGHVDVDIRPYSARALPVTGAFGGEQPVLQSARVLTLGGDFGNCQTVDAPVAPAVLGIDWGNVSGGVDIGQSVGGPAASRHNVQNGASEKIIALLGGKPSAAEGWSNRLLSLGPQPHQHQPQQHQRLPSSGVEFVQLGNEVLAIGNNGCVSSLPQGAGQPSFMLPSDSASNMYMLPNFNLGQAFAPPGEQCLPLASSSFSTQRNGLSDESAVQGSVQERWYGNSQQSAQGDRKTVGGMFDQMGHVDGTMFGVSSLNSNSGGGGQVQSRGVKDGSWRPGREVTRSASGSASYWG